MPLQNLRRIIVSAWLTIVTCLMYIQENMRYDQLRDAVAKRKPGWEYLQQVRQI